MLRCILDQYDEHTAPIRMPERALALTCGFFDSVFAKTTHGLLRGPSRFPLAGVVDASYAGQDAGTVLDGQSRGVPFFGSVAEALDLVDQQITHCIVGVATVGGVLPPALRADLDVAARHGLTLVSGLHSLLQDDAHLASLVARHGGQIIDIRKPRPASELRFWSGDIYKVPALRVAVLGMDCAIGKRTTAMLLREACRARGIRAEVVYTGQTGWLQGLDHGFIFDATLNDFVSGELEGAILRCYEATKPQVILLEGQSGLRNPSGPAGSELILSGAAHGVILQHAPGRRHYEDFEAIECEIPPVQDEVALVRQLGSEVWAVTLFTKGLTANQVSGAQAELRAALGLPVVPPLQDGVEHIVNLVEARL